jgi:AraC-like DNA-binding protein
MEQFPQIGHLKPHSSIVLPHLPFLEPIEPIPNWRGVDRDRSLLIMQCLRRTAQQSRRNKKSRPFYSIRTVARHFAVAPTTVSRIYTRLKDEGLLTSVWGSKTFVQPTQLNKQLRMRAVIAMPALLPRFRTLPEYRMFFVSVQDALWKLGFATRLAFHEGRDAETPLFAELLLNYKADVVIWFLPTSKNLNVAARLLDRGIRLITIGDSLASPGEHCYLVNRQNAFREGLIAWKRDGIHSITVVHQPGCESVAKLAAIEASLCEVGIPHTIANLEACCAREHLWALSQRDNSAVIFPSSEFAALLGSRNPAQFRALFKQRRVMLVDGLIDLPAEDSCGATVDFIAVDWQAAAKRIGRDLVSPAPCKNGTIPIVFQAKWMQRHPKGELIPQLSFSP